jgi:pimeloyl-ACP methyl ester carboxylesterase
MTLANVNGINIDYMIEGQGEAVIMISGGGADKSSWRYQTKEFRKYYRTITFDNRGVGKSDKPSGLYSMKILADDAVGLMSSLGIGKAHVLGMSSGGMVAQELAINYPEMVNKLVLACTYARRDEISGFSSEVENVYEAYERSHDEASQRRYLDVMMDLQINKRSYRIFLLPLMKLVTRFMTLPKNLGAIFEAVGTHDAFDRLGLIKAPTLVIAGTMDRVIKPVSSEVLAGLIPQAKLVKVTGVGHSFPIEMSGEFNREVLDFLRS